MKDIEEHGDHTVIEVETLTDGSTVFNVLWTSFVTIRFCCCSEQEAVDLADQLELTASIEVVAVKPKCANDDCDRPAEPGRDLCAQCHDRAGEAQDARDAEGLY